MTLKEEKIDTCKKERMIWLLISVVSAIVFIGLMTSSVVYNMRSRYGFYIVALNLCIMYFSFIMNAFTQYISTKEIVSILVGKIVGNED